MCTYPLQTEHGLTPSQLWTRGLCIASSSVIDQPEQYGIDHEYVNPFNLDSVIIPETVGLIPLQLDYLCEHHPRLAHSEYQGFDRYLAVLNTVCNASITAKHDIVTIFFTETLP